MENIELESRAVRRLLVTDEDVLNEAERIVKIKLMRNNLSENECLTATEMARELSLEVHDLNSFLCDMGIQKWRRGRFVLTPRYEGMGLAKDRLFIYYGKDGRKKQQTYLVWTLKGLEFIKKRINIKTTKK